MGELIKQDRRGGRTAKTRVEACRAIDIGSWARAGRLQPGTICTDVMEWKIAKSGEFTGKLTYTIDMTGPHVRLQHPQAKTGERLDYRVRLATTHLYGGALRWWFMCPVTVAGRACPHRVRKLYLPPGGRYFACRHCWQLRYTSQREDAINRAITKALAIRQRLGGSASLTERFPAKPQGMWCETHRRLRRKWEECLGIICSEHVRKGQ